MIIEQSQPIAVSLIVATHGRVDELRAFLKSVQALDDQNLEVIVADQNSDDRIVAVLQDCPMPVRHLRLKLQNANAARNAGAQLASHAWLGFPDDDCCYLPQTLAQFRQAAALAQDAAIIAGLTVNEAGVPNIVNWSSRAKYFDPWEMFRCMSESTLFIKRNVFDQSAGFDPAFGPGGLYPAAEGAELLLRVFSQSSKIRAWFSPHIQIYHPTKIPPWDDAAYERVYDYALGEGAVLAKHPVLPMWWRAAKFVVKHAVAAALPLGGLSRCSRRKLVGLARGYSAYARHR